MDLGPAPAAPPLSSALDGEHSAVPQQHQNLAMSDSDENFDLSDEEMSDPGACQMPLSTRVSPLSVSVSAKPDDGTFEAIQGAPALRLTDVRSAAQGSRT